MYGKTERGNIRPGTKVLVVQKQHQQTGELTEGFVKDILTNSKIHHRGIKVRLQSGIVGRVQKEWDKYGADTFSIEIIERLEKKPEQEDKEFKKEITLLEEMWKSKQ